MRASGDVEGPGSGLGTMDDTSMGPGSDFDATDDGTGSMGPMSGDFGAGLPGSEGPMSDGLDGTSMGPMGDMFDPMDPMDDGFGPMGGPGGFDDGVEGPGSIGGLLPPVIGAEGPGGDIDDGMAFVPEGEF